MIDKHEPTMKCSPQERHLKTSRWRNPNTAIKTSQKVTRATGAGGSKGALSYVGIWLFHTHFHSEVFSLFRMREVWAENPGDLL